MLVNKMNLSELQAEIIDNDDLLLLAGGMEKLGAYNEQELRNIITTWIMDGDECSN